MLNSPLEQYRELLNEWNDKIKNQRYTLEKGYFLDKMTEVWNEMSPEEQDIIIAQSPKVNY